MINRGPWARYGNPGLAEVHRDYVPYHWPHDGSRRALLLGHGAGATDPRMGPSEKALCRELNCVGIAGMLGGATEFGSDTALTAVTAAWQYAITAYNAKPDKFIWFGGSMGGLTGPLYALDHPEDVAALATAIPGMDPEFVRINNIGGFQAAIEAEYGANPVPAEKQLYQRGADWRATGIPMFIASSTDDAVTPLASIDQYVLASGAQHVSMGAVGHTYQTVLDVDEVAAFLRPYAE